MGGAISNVFGSLFSDLVLFHHYYFQQGTQYPGDCVAVSSGTIVLVKDISAENQVATASWCRSCDLDVDSVWLR